MNTCILVKTVPNQTDEVLEAVLKIRGVRKAFIAYGRYDLVAFAHSPEYSGVSKLTAEVNALSGVRSTETLVEA
jgi:DNA-binding Lrp family transcriptional regulator